MTLPAYAMSQSSFPEMYERHLVGALFRPWAEVLIERTAPQPGERVLDIACGTGIVARLASEHVGPGGRVAGVDMSPPMLEVARRLAPEVDWREADAAALPFGDGSFDLVLCQQGLQFFPDRPAAVREMRRVLADGGRVGVAVWQSVEANPVLGTLQQVAERRLGPITDARYSFGDAAALDGLLSTAGFAEVRVESMSLPIRLEDGAMFVQMNAMALVGLSSSGKAMADEERARTAAAIAEESAAAVRPHMRGAAIVFDIGANLATARS